MWVLRSAKGEVYYLVSGQHTVGRKGCSLILEGDASISRNHAKIEVSDQGESLTDLHKQPVVTVCDTGSKYGTSLLSPGGSEKVTAVPKKLNKGDEIHFGLQWNKWKVCFEPLVVAVSSLSRQERQSVKEQVVKLGGSVVKEWLPEVTHLTMSSITMTVKAICALAHAKPIVKPQFWQSYVTAAEAKHDFPKCEDFLPPLNESNINKNEVSFLPNPKRSTLFRGMTFAFFSNVQFKEHGCLVRAAGGEAKLIDIYKFANEDFIEPNVVVMLHLGAVNSQDTLFSQCSPVPYTFPKLCDFLKANGKRPVPSSEIGLAILHCSIEKFCNPNFSFSSMFLRNSEELDRNVVKEEILATETQDICQDRFVNSGIVIPDSGTESKIGGGIDDDSNTEMPQENQSSEPTRKTRAAKRVIEESDDEVEEIHPVKKTARSKTPVSQATRETPSTSRRSTVKSQRFDEQTSEDAEDLFADFLEPTPKDRPSKVSHIKEDVEDIFDGFEDNSPKQSQQKSKVPPKPPTKRELPSDDENDRPPLKRLEMMELADEKRPLPSNSQQTNGSQEEQEFISVSNIKEEPVDAPTYNASVIVKSLMVTKTLNTTATTSSSLVDENVKNFKRFKKVQPLNNSIIPRIIGGADLELYRSGSRMGCDSVLGNSDSEDEGRPGTLWHEMIRTKPSNSKSSTIASWVRRR